MAVWGYFGITSKIAQLEIDVLRMKDAVEMNSTFGETYHLGIFDGEIDVIDGFQEGDISAAINYLLQNNSIGEPLRGQTWSERTSMHVALTDDDSSLRYLKIRVDVIAETSEQTSNLAEEFEKQAALIESEGYINADVHIGGEDKNVVVSVFSEKGDLIYRKEQQVQDMSRLTEIDLSLQITGTYIVVMESKTVRKTFKIIKR